AGRTGAALRRSILLRERLRVRACRRGGNGPRSGRSGEALTRPSPVLPERPDLIVHGADLVRRTPAYRARPDSGRPSGSGWAAHPRASIPRPILVGPPAFSFYAGSRRASCPRSCPWYAGAAGARPRAGTLPFRARARTRG